MTDLKELSEKEMKAELARRKKAKEKNEEAEWLAHPMRVAIREVYPKAFNKKSYGGTYIRFDLNGLKKLPKEVLDKLYGDSGTPYFETGYELIKTLEKLKGLEVYVSGNLRVYSNKEEEWPLSLQEYGISVKVNDGLTAEQLKVLSTFQGRYTYCFLGGEWITLTDHPE